MTDRPQNTSALPTFIWNTLPQRFGRLSPLLGVVLQDGRYLSGLPFLGNSLGIIGVLAGFSAGLADRGGLPYTANLWMLAVVMMLGILSGQAGFWAFLGFVIADAIGMVRADTGVLSLGCAGAAVISWFFLFQLVAGLPQAARFLGNFKGRWALLNGLVAAIFVAGGAELWTRLSMVALRPLFTWQGADAPLELVEFIDPRNEWLIGDLAFHKLAWLAFAVGLARWILTPLVESFAAPVSGVEHDGNAREVPFGLAAFGRAVSFTAIVAGVFTTIAGALVFFISILGVVSFRGHASANQAVARWDGLMLRIPAAIRLIASYALCYYLAEALVGLFRDTLEWRTMTIAGAATAATFAVSLLFWPQVSPAHDAPTPPEVLQSLFRGAVKAVPRAMLLFLMFGASAAYAHHCSFEPGCECLTDNGALAALVAAMAVLAHLWEIASRPFAPETSLPLEPTGPGSTSTLASEAASLVPSTQMALDITKPGDQGVPISASALANANLSRAIEDSWDKQAVSGYPNYANCSGLLSSVSTSLNIQGLAGKNAMEQLEYLTENSGVYGSWENLGTDHMLASQRAEEGQFVVAIQIADGEAPIGSHVAIVLPGVTTGGTDANGYAIKPGWPKAAWGLLDGMGAIDGALRSSFYPSDIDDGKVGYFSIPIPH